MSEIGMENSDKIAVIGLSARFPSAESVDQYWENLCQGVEAVRCFGEEELESNASENHKHRSFVASNAIVDDVDMFDAEYFGYSIREAQIADPQHRILLECSDEALINGGYSADKYQGNIGVFVGSASSSYFKNNVSGHPELIKAMGELQAAIASEKSFAATKISYKLGLTGPSITMDTACSTSLVAIHQACSSLLSCESDMALAGGVAIDIPQAVGHIYQPGGIASPDGHCRPFDAEAEGTVRGYGAGIVLLKRLEDAVADGDTIYAVVIGSAVNNDGQLKPGYTAPSVEGQREVIAATHAFAEINAETIGYIEAHGTGTELGDPVEIQALTQAFARTSDKYGYCGIGSVKGNIGHLDIAAGVAGFIKTVLILKHGLIPPLLHFKKPNPKIDFDATPFYVVDKLTPWPNKKMPRRAGVSSFGIGGTNAHVLLESYDLSKIEREENKSRKLLLFSAHSEPALDAILTKHVEFFHKNSNLPLSAVSFTLRDGRKEHPFRAAVIAKDVSDAANKLSELDTMAFGQAQKTRPDVVFMFAGQGVQKVNMLIEVYRGCPLFKSELDNCADIISINTGWNLLEVLYPKTDLESAQKVLDQTKYTQPVLFCVQYALAKLLISWGIRPDFMIGHSLGEFVAATLAGVFSLVDALKLVVGRAELMNSLPGGDMLAVTMGEQEIRPLLSADLSIAAINAPQACVVAGPETQIATLDKKLRDKGFFCQLLNTSHAFHSSMMDPVLDNMRSLLVGITLNKPEINYISNVTGKTITVSQATNADYWLRHLRNTVRFADGITTLGEHPDLIYLELAPGHTLSSLITRNGVEEENVIPLLSQQKLDLPSNDILKQQLAQFWCMGGHLDWNKLDPLPQNRVTLPNYCYQRKSYWLQGLAASAESRESGLQIQRMVWKRSERPSAEIKQPRQILIVNCWKELNSELVMECRRRGIGCTQLIYGKYESTNSEIPTKAEIDALIWFTTNPNEDTHKADEELIELFNLVKQLNTQLNMPRLKLLICNRSTQSSAHKAMMASVASVAEKEFPNIKGNAVEIEEQGMSPCNITSEILMELCSNEPESKVSLSAEQRYTPKLEMVKVKRKAPVRQKGTYLITGGCGGIGQVIALHLASKYKADLFLLGRSSGSRHQPFLAKLRDSGADIVRYIQVDICDKVRLESISKSLRIDGLIHAAGINRDSSWMYKEAETIREVLAAKLLGTHNLDACFGFSNLDFVVLCSTAGVITGVPFQIDYLAANAYLDGFANDRRGVGNICSVNWGVWKEAPLSKNGMEKNSDELRRNLELGISNSQAIQLFEQAIASGESQVIAATKEQIAFLQNYGKEDLNKNARINENVRRTAGEIESVIKEIWGLLLGKTDIEIDANFFDLGGDSLLIVQQGRMIQDSMDVKLTAVELFNYPTVKSLVSHIAGLQSTEQSAPHKKEPQNSGNTELGIAIIGMSLRVPGADTLTQFWDNLRAGKDSIEDYSDGHLLERGLSENLLENKNYVKCGYMLADIEQFDAELFGFTPNEAILTDPQQRKLLECTHEALQLAGYEDTDKHSEVGVFVGTAMSSYLLHQILPYKNLSGQSMVDSLQLQTGNSQDYAATQIAYRLGLKGPAINVNSACSSSLVAVHIACQSILQGDCELAIAGGASIRIPMGLGFQYAEGSVESASGRCRPFDADADGTIMSSGAGVVVLKKLNLAMRDGDHIHAVIKGSAINNDGNHKVSFGAPSTEGQKRVIVAALENAKVDASSISYIEAHGTGTRMGDPIEFEALKQSLDSDGPDCYIGSVKSNVGHLDTCAGIIGLIKTALMMEHQALVPTANFSTPNPHLSIGATRFRLLSEYQKWSSGSDVLRAGISSFGIGGSNAHVILQNFPIQQVEKRALPNGQLILLSAHSAIGLDQIRQRLVNKLQHEGHRFHSQIDISKMAFTLAVRRKHRQHRQFVYIRKMQECVLKLPRREHLGRVESVTIEPVMILSSWSQLPLRWIYSLSQEVGLFAKYFDEFCLACPNYADVLRSYQGNQGASGCQDNLAGFALGYAIYKTLSQWVKFDYKPLDMHGQWLNASLQNHRPLEETIAKFINSDKFYNHTEKDIHPTKNQLTVSLDKNETAEVCLHEGKEARESIYTLVGELWVCGVDVNWNTIHSDSVQKNITLPSYVYQRKSYWYGNQYKVISTKTIDKPDKMIFRDRPEDGLQSYVAGENQLEKDVVNLWERVIGIRPIGVNDDFFTLGGHSLMATQVITEVKQRFNIVIKLEQIYELLTPAKMASYILLQQTNGIDNDLLEQLLTNAESTA